MSLYQNKLLLVHGKRCFVSPASEIGMLLITTFLELRVVVGRSRMWAGCPHAVPGRPMLIHTYHAVPMLCCAVALRGRFQNGIVVAWQGNGMACVNQTRPQCKSNGKDNLTPWRNGMAGERHGMCVLALNQPYCHQRTSGEMYV
jgi:hypothetical protein